MSVRWIPADESGRDGGIRTFRTPGPSLADELVAEVVVWLVVDEPESRSLVEVASGVEDVAGPERDPFVAGRSGEADALVDQPRANVQHTRSA